MRNDLTMPDEITIMGKDLPVGGIQQKIRAAFHAGAKEVILPAYNLKEAHQLPSYITDALKLTCATRIEDVLEVAFVK